MDCTGVYIYIYIYIKSNYKCIQVSRVSDINKSEYITLDLLGCAILSAILFGKTSRCDCH